MKKDILILMEAIDRIDVAMMVVHSAYKDLKDKIMGDEDASE